MTTRRNRTRRLSRSELRTQSQNRMGLMIIIACALAFTGMFYGAYKIDQSRGITVCQSMAGSGFGNSANCIGSN